MIDVAVALAVHMAALVWWLGGVAFVTTVVLPRVREEEHPQAAFQHTERRFAPQARVAMLLVGVSGVYLLWRFHAWHWFAMGRYWWLSAMSAYWLFFFFMLFVAEPLGVFGKGGESAPAAQWVRRTLRLHRLLLAVGLVIVGAATAGMSGWG